MSTQLCRLYFGVYTLLLQFNTELEIMSTLYRLYFGVYTLLLQFNMHRTWNYVCNPYFKMSFSEPTDNGMLQIFSFLIKYWALSAYLMAIYLFLQLLRLRLVWNPLENCEDDILWLFWCLLSSGLNCIPPFKSWYWNIPVPMV